MKLLLKVCGMREAQNIEQVASLGPDLMGFIFYPKSKRYVGDDFQIGVLSSDIKRVGVFVNETTDHILSLVKTHQLDLVQLHGDEELSKVKALKREGIGVMKVFSVSDSLPIEKIEEFETDVDYFLFDTKTPEYGGSGQHFDWNLLKQYPSTVPYLLSGGIKAEDIENIKKLQLPGLIGIDVNSRVELEPGLKKIEKVRQVKELIG